MTDLVPLGEKAQRYGIRADRIADERKKQPCELWETKILTAPKFYLKCSLAE